MALATVAVLGLAGSAQAQNFGGLGGFGNFGGATMVTPGVGFTSFGVPAAVSNGWGYPAGYGYGGFGMPYGYGAYSPYGYGYSPYNYGYVPYSSGYGAFYPGAYQMPQMGNNLGGLMGVIQGNTGQGNWRR
jgi:hypothetical protein